MKKSLLFMFIAMIALFIFGCDMGGQSTQDPEGDYVISFFDGDSLIKKVYLNDGDEIPYPTTPQKEGYYFDGWYEDGKYLFDLRLMPRGDVNLYAQFKKGYTYRFVNYDDSLIFEGTGTENSEISVPADPERPKEGRTLYTFIGWDKEIKPLTANVTYKALYSSQDVYTVTYSLDGGNWDYYSYDDVVKALLYDYNKYGGTSYTISNVPTGAYENINCHSFLLTPKYKEKWGWLIKYFGDHAALVNRQAFKALSRANVVSDLSDDNYKYSISYELRAFLRGDVINSNMSFVSNNYQDYDLQMSLWSYYAAEVEKTLVQYVPVNNNLLLLKKVYKQNYNFIGWHTKEDFSDAVINSYTLTDDITFYAEFKQIDPPTSIELLNSVEELEKLATYQLNWNVLPSDVKDKRVKFKSSNSSIATVSSTGLITVLGTGSVTITVSSVLSPQVNAAVTIEAFSPNHFNVSYKTTSICKVGETIELDAKYILRNGNEEELQLTSLNPDVLVVSGNMLTGVSKGFALVELKASDNETMTVGVTVVNENESLIADLLLESHNSNIMKVYNLGIGDGVPAYYMDIIGSVNNIIFNDPYVINNKYYEAQQKVSSNHGGEKTSTEFITVHYTGNMSKTADGNANANYFANGGNGTSIHYVTGNDGTYYCLDEKYVGFHAGDGTQVTFEWIPSGVMVNDCDPEKPVISFNEDLYYTINGHATSVHLPGGGPSNFTIDDKWINLMGIGYTVIDGEYYLATTYWCYSQVSEGRLCNHGGNNNSIGIESCVNLGSDLWYTWQKTAQLVADLMDRYSLDITRVVGHHFFTAKDCPQPMLENDLELWYEFLRMVKSEYQLRTVFSDYEIKMDVLSETNSLKATGRVSQPRLNECLIYKLTITNKTTQAQEELILSSLVTGQLDK